MDMYMGRTFLNGTLTGTSATPFSMVGATCPCSISLESSNSSRLIELSVNGGVEYFTPTYDVTSSTMLVVAVKAPVTHVRFTGQSGDAYRVV